MFASGLKEDAVSKLLPTITRYASAAKANPVELANVAIKAKRNFGISDEQMPTALNMAIAAGQAGNFELADMAKWLGPQMAAAHGAGMSGLNDLKKLLTLNELSSLTAGSNDEAGNNVVDLLGKLTSVDTARAAARIKVNGKGIDLPNTMAGAREKGLDQIEALSRVIDTVVAKNKNYQKLQARLQALGKDDKDGMRDTLTAMSTILEGAGVGKIIADRRALMAMIAYRNGKGYKAEIDSKINAQQHLKPGESGAGDLNFEFNSQQPWYKADQAKNAWDFAQMDAVKGPAHLVGTFAGGLADAAEKFPGLATAVAGATTAIQAMTQAAWAMAGLKLLSSLTGGAAKTVTTAATTTAEGGWLSRAAGTAGRGLLGRVLGKLFVPIAAYEGAEDEPLIQVERAKDKRARVEAAGYKLPEGFSSPGLLDVWDEWFGKNASARDTVAPSQVLSVTDPRRHISGLGSNQYPSQPQKIELNNKTVLEVDGQTLAEVINRYNVQDAARGTGAGGGQ
ncbi:phage tail tape measure protein [Salmonella enterica]|nr:phage tail tape measure protein [Salmonella enterica]